MKQAISNLCVAVLRFVVLFVVISVLSQCTSAVDETREELEEKKALLSDLYTIHSEDSLLLALQQFSEEDNAVGKMIVYKQLGILQRENARFSDAINSHQQNLEIALKLTDTIEIVQAMNNLGTNFRRIGAHNEASQYHYRALHYIESW